MTGISIGEINSFMVEEVYLPIIQTEVSPDEIRHNVLFRAKLSNGQTAYSKEGRRSWLELKEWLKENPLIKITGLCISFRDHFKCLPSDKSGYFFSHGVQCWGGGPTQHTMIIGYIENDILYREKFIIPELISNGNDNFSINDYSIQNGLIC